jgi:PhnB protein
VFGTEFVSPIVRMGDPPSHPDQPEMSDEEKNLVLVVRLPIVGGHLLVGNNAPAELGTVTHGNALDIGLEMDTRADAALAEGGTVDHELGEAFLGNYFGSVIDRVGTTWVVGCAARP